jgi:hypothetical protein
LIASKLPAAEGAAHFWLDKDFYYKDVALHDKKQFSNLLFVNQLYLNLFVFGAKGMCLKHK